MDASCIQLCAYSNHVLCTTNRYRTPSRRRPVRPGPALPGPAVAVATTHDRPAVTGGVPQAPLSQLVLIHPSVPGRGWPQPQPQPDASELIDRRSAPGPTALAVASFFLSGSNKRVPSAGVRAVLCCSRFSPSRPVVQSGQARLQRRRPSVRRRQRPQAGMTQKAQSHSCPPCKFPVSETVPDTHASNIES